MLKTVEEFIEEVEGRMAALPLKVSIQLLPEEKELLQRRAKMLQRSVDEEVELIVTSELEENKEMFGEEYEEHHLIPDKAVIRWHWLKSEREKLENIVRVTSEIHRILESQATKLVRQAISGEAKLLVKLWKDNYELNTSEYEQLESEAKHLITDWLIIRLIKVPMQTHQQA